MTQFHCAQFATPVCSHIRDISSRCVYRDQSPSTMQIALASRRFIRCMVSP